MIFVMNTVRIPLRLYEMFLGPLEQAKPWNTAGITGVYWFLEKIMAFVF